MSVKLIPGSKENPNLFPDFNGTPLSWDIGSYMTFSQEKEDYPKARLVIRAMFQYRPQQLEAERREMVRGSFDRVFGKNAKKELDLIDDELRIIEHSASLEKYQKGLYAK